MDTLYIDNIEDLYSFDTGSWYRDDVVVTINDAITSGKQVLIRDWNIHIPRMSEKVPRWLCNNKHSIHSNDLDVLGFVIPENSESRIVTKRGDFPLHPIVDPYAFFGEPDCDIRLDQLPAECNADIVFVPLDLDSAQNLVSSSVQHYNNRVVVYLDENNEVPLSSWHANRDHAGQLVMAPNRSAIVFVDPESLIAIANSKQRVINIIRQFGYQSVNNHKFVVVTDGSYDEGFFDGTISLYFRSVL